MVDNIKRLRQTFEDTKDEVEQLEREEAKTRTQIQALSKRINDLTAQKDSFRDELADAKKTNIKLKRQKERLIEQNQTYEELLEKYGIAATNAMFK